MINLLFFNPLNLSSIVHLVGTNRWPAITYVPLTASTLQGKRGMTQQLAEMTSKCFLPQAFANYRSLVLGGDPSSAGVNRVTSTAAYNKDQTSVQPVRRPSMKPCYDHGFHESTAEGKKRRVRLEEEASLTALTCLPEPPRADRHRGLRQMFGKTAPFIMALLWNLFELCLFFFSSPFLNFAPNTS